MSGAAREEFINALELHQRVFGLDLSAHTTDRLADYYALVKSANPLLHLVAPCHAEEFAIRHILESLTLLEHLKLEAKFVDVGTGAGLPSIPCLIARSDLTATLIESKSKKAGFLASTLETLDLAGRASVTNKQFTETERGDAAYVTCRALDRFSENLPRLIKWSGDRTMLLFGGNSLAEALRAHRIRFEPKLMPLSLQRFLFVAAGK